MARQRRLNEAGTYHHITARGVDRCRIFLDDGDRRQFLALLSESQRRFGCCVIAFCLMDNHLHLTVLDELGTLSKTLHYLNGVYAKKFNLKHGRTGHLFERRFWSSLIDSDAYLTNCVKYVHRNPVEAGIVERPEDYRWSSYPSYAGLRSLPAFLNTSLVLDHYGGSLVALRRDTETASETGVLLRQLESTNPPPRLGPKQNAGSGSTEGSNIDRRISADAVPINLVLAACAAVVGIDVETMLQKQPGRRNEARDMAAFVAHRHAGHSLVGIAPVLGAVVVGRIASLSAIR